MTAGLSLQPDTCPRCGAVFKCGAAGPWPCACASVGLSAELREQLAQRFEGCLCLACLQALAQGAALDAAGTRS